MSALFWLANVAVAPFWLVMIALPRWPATPRLLRSPWIVAPPAVLYVGLALTQLGPLLAATRDLDPASLMALFATEPGARLVWLHMLTLDLFAGRWIYLDSLARGLPARLLAPALLLTLLAGPLGLMLYLLLRSRSPARASP